MPYYNRDPKRDHNFDFHRGSKQTYISTLKGMLIGVMILTQTRGRIQKVDPLMGVPIKYP